MALNLEKYTRYKITKHYEIWLEKDPTNPKQRQVLIHYLNNPNKWMQATLSDALFKLFFKPEEYRQIYMQNTKQRCS
jgi:hypothetical protein